MAGNPYTYGATGAYDQRWTSKEGTTTVRLNYARAMCDYLRYALAKVMNPALADEYGTWEAPFNLGGTTGWYTWWDAGSGCRREKTGSAPSSATDGMEIGGGTVI